MPLPPFLDPNREKEKLPPAPDAPPVGGKPVKFPVQGQPPPRAPGTPPSYAPDDEDD